jgi:hypothetical protein
MRTLLGTFGSKAVADLNEGTLPIPQGAPAIVTMFESIPLAIRTQSGHAVALAETPKKVADLEHS